MSLEMRPRPPGREGRAPGRGRPLRVALSALSITAALAALITALVLLLSDCAGGPDDSDPASLRSVSQASRNAQSAPSGRSGPAAALRSGPALPSAAPLPMHALAARPAGPSSAS